MLVDANVWYSAILYGGTPEQSVNYCLENYHIVLSNTLLEEITVTLKRDATVPYRWLRLMRQEFRRICFMAEATLPALPVTRDPKDEHIIAAALETNCHCIITGDKDLLALATYQDIPILSPTDFIKLTKN